MEEEEGRLAEGDFPQTREAEIEKPDEGDLEMDAGEEGERKIEPLEKEGGDILRRDEQDKTMVKQLPKVETDTQSEVCSFFTLFPSFSTLKVSKL